MISLIRNPKKMTSPAPSYKTNASEAPKALPKKSSVKFQATGTSLKELLPGRWFSSNGMLRAEHHLANFVHRDRVVKYAAALGIGGAAVTGILMAVGVIQVAAIGAFFASPMGHGVAIGLGAAVGAYLLFRVGKYAYGKMKKGAKETLERTKAMQESAYAASQPFAPQAPLDPSKSNLFFGFSGRSAA